MNIPIEEKKVEAVERMQLLGIYAPTIQQFKKQGILSAAEPPFGGFFWVEGEDLEHVREFETKFNALVYVVVRAYHKELGRLDSYLFVSDYREEWELDHEDLKNLKTNGIMAYVYNNDCSYFSDMGHIGIEKIRASASLRRTW